MHTTFLSPPPPLLSPLIRGQDGRGDQERQGERASMLLKGLGRVIGGGDWRGVAITHYSLSLPSFLSYLAFIFLRFPSSAMYFTPISRVGVVGEDAGGFGG
jgi:hypothetical protein